MATPNELAKRFIGEAQKNPAEREEIFRKAAYTFVGLAQNPKNVKSQEKLSKIGLDFAHAANREKEHFTTDDFTDLLTETHQAYNEVGDDPQDLQARRRQIHDERDPGHAKQIAITPESFNTDATLGRSALITGIPTPEQAKQGITQSQNVAFWQGTKKETQAMTVDVSLGSFPSPQINLNIYSAVAPPPVLFLSPGNPLANYPNLRNFGTVQEGQIPLFTHGTVGTRAQVIGEVEYGSDGNRNKVRFDIGYGRRFTVIGNYIAVTVSVDGESQVYTAGASIGAFAAPTPAVLTYTQRIDQLPTAQRTIFQLPLRASAMLPVLSTMLLAETSKIDFLNDQGEVITSSYFTQTIVPGNTPVPLSPDVAFVQITNGGAFANNFRLPFQLSM